jgi:hypothetical protein
MKRTSKAINQRGSTCIIYTSTAKFRAPVYLGNSLYIACFRIY